jgi:hypothetical protein
MCWSHIGFFSYIDDIYSCPSIYQNIFNIVLPNLYLDNYHLVIYLYIEVSISKCVSTIVATLGSDTTLVVVLGFFDFNFCYIYFL